MFPGMLFAHSSTPPATSRTPYRERTPAGHQHTPSPPPSSLSSCMLVDQEAATPYFDDSRGFFAASPSFDDGVGKQGPHDGDDEVPTIMNSDDMMMGGAAVRADTIHDGIPSFHHSPLSWEGLRKKKNSSDCQNSVGQKLHHRSKTKVRTNEAKNKWNDISFKDPGAIAFRENLVKEVLDQREQLRECNVTVTFPDVVPDEALGYFLPKYGPQWEFFDLTKHGDRDAVDLHEQRVMNAKTIREQQQHEQQHHQPSMMKKPITHPQSPARDGMNNGPSSSSSSSVRMISDGQRGGRIVGEGLWSFRVMGRGGGSGTPDGDEEEDDDDGGAPVDNAAIIQELLESYQPDDDSTDKREQTRRRRMPTDSTKERKNPQMMNPSLYSTPQSSSTRHVEEGDFEPPPTSRFERRRKATKEQRYVISRPSSSSSSASHPSLATSLPASNEYNSSRDSHHQQWNVDKNNNSQKKKKKKKKGDRTTNMSSSPSATGVGTRNGVTAYEAAQQEEAKKRDKFMESYRYRTTVNGIGRGVSAVESFFAPGPYTRPEEEDGTRRGDALSTTSSSAYATSLSMNELAALMQVENNL